MSSIILGGICMKKTIGIILVLTLLIAIAGCAGDQTTTVPEKEILPCMYVIPGNAQDDVNLVTDEVNKKMQADGVPVELVLNYIAWDVWGQKTNLMLSTGEEFEMIHIMQDLSSTQHLYSLGALAALDDLLDQHGQVILDKIPDDVWLGSFVDGKTYSIPTNWISTSNTDGWISYRKDLLDKYDHDIPTSVDEMISILEDIDEKEEKKYYFYCKAQAAIPLFPFHRTYESWPFFTFGGDLLFYVSQEGKAEFFFETDAFEKDANYMRILYEKDLILPDLLTLKMDEMEQQFSAANWVFFPERYLVGIENSPEFIKNAPEGEVSAFQFNPDLPKLRYASHFNANGVSITSNNPEAPVMFLNWLYSEQENHDLFIYGIEDVHYEPIGDDLIKTIDIDNPKYRFAQWMTGLIDYIRYEEGTPQLRIQMETTDDPTSVSSPATSFRFNPENVSVEFANCKTELLTSIIPVYYGFLSYEEQYEIVMQKMRAAGIDEVLQEYQSQLTEFNESN